MVVIIPPVRGLAHCYTELEEECTHMEPVYIKETPASLTGVCNNYIIVLPGKHMICINHRFCSVTTLLLFSNFTFLTNIDLTLMLWRKKNQ